MPQITDLGEAVVYLTTEQLAKRVGVTTKTIRRWYGVYGVLERPTIRRRGKRGTFAVWPESAVAKCERIQALSLSGMSMSAIRDSPAKRSRVWAVEGIRPLGQEVTFGTTTVQGSHPAAPSTGNLSTMGIDPWSIRPSEIEKSLIDARVKGHGEGQEHALADVRARVVEMRDRYAARWQGRLDYTARDIRDDLDYLLAWIDGTVD